MESIIESHVKCEEFALLLLEISRSTKFSRHKYYTYARSCKSYFITFQKRRKFILVLAYLIQNSGILQLVY